MEWLDDLLQVLGLWLFFATACAAGVSAGIKHALKNLNINVKTFKHY